MLQENINENQDDMEVVLEEEDGSKDYEKWMCHELSEYLASLNPIY